MHHEPTTAIRTLPLSECHKVSELQGLTETVRGGLPIGLVVVLRVLSESLVELDTLDQRFRTQGCVMSSADVW